MTKSCSLFPTHFGTGTYSGLTAQDWDWVLKPYGNGYSPQNK